MGEFMLDRAHIDAEAAAEGQDSSMTAYADLFAQLSVIFLFLYVVSTLQINLKVFSDAAPQATRSSAGQDASPTTASGSTAQESDPAAQARRLALIESKALKDAERMVAQAQSVQEQNRELVTGYRSVLAQAEQDKSQLRQELREAQQARAQTQTALQQTQENLKRAQLELGKTRDSTETLQAAQQQLKQEKQQLQAEREQLAAALKTSSRQLEQLQSAQTKAQGNVAELSKSRAAVEAQLKATEAQLAELNTQNRASSGEKQRLLGERDKLLAEKAAIARDLSQNMGRAAGLEKDLQAAKHRGDALAGSLAGAEKALAAKGEQLGTLGNQLGAARAQLADLAKDKQGLERAKRDLERQRDALARDLADAKQARAAAEAERQKLADDRKRFADEAAKQKQLADRLADEKKKTDVALGDTGRALKDLKDKQKLRNDVVNRLNDAFKRENIPASVDGTGTVTLRFRENFDYDSSALKPTMEEDIRRLFPVYARTLFETQGVQGKVQNVELVGFASPTYRGQYVNPASLSPTARQAINYNLDLSYRRARSIFRYAFDTAQLKYPYQGDLLRVLKVTGRGYLSSRPLPTLVDKDTLSREEFCARYDCNEDQAVLIRFNLIDGGLQ